MFQGRRTFVRMASMAAGAGCLALAACSSGASTGTPGATGTQPSAVVADPLAGLTANQVAAMVVADTETVPGLTLKGAVTQKGETDTVDMAIKPGRGCTGTMTVSGHGSFKLTEIGKTIYLEPDKKFWQVNGGADAQALSLLDGKYLKVPSTDKNFGDLASLCDVKQMFSSDGKKNDVLTKGKVTTLSATRVLPLNDATQDNVSDVTDTSKPRLVAITAVKGGASGTGRITATYGTPVTLTPPPASQVLDGATLGL